jgi:hypothetical protein
MAGAAALGGAIHAAATLGAAFAVVLVVTVGDCGRAAGCATRVAKGLQKEAMRDARAQASEEEPSATAERADDEIGVGRG